MKRDDVLDRAEGACQARFRVESVDATGMLVVRERCDGQREKKTLKLR